MEELHRQNGTLRNIFDLIKTNESNGKLTALARAQKTIELLSQKISSVSDKDIRDVEIEDYVNSPTEVNYRDIDCAFESNGHDYPYLANPNPETAPVRDMIGRIICETMTFPDVRSQADDLKKRYSEN